MNPNKKNTIISVIAIIVVIAIAAFLLLKVKHTAKNEAAMPGISQTDDALNAPNGTDQTKPAQVGSAATPGITGNTAPTVGTMPAVQGMTLISKLGLEIPYPVDYTFTSQPQGNLASPTCTKDGVDTNTGAKCNYITPNMGSELITFVGHGNTENVEIITSDTSGYNANACTSIAGTSAPSLNVGGKTVYHTTNGNSETFCAVTPTYTFNLTRNISTTPEIDVTKILFK